MVDGGIEHGAGLTERILKAIGSSRSVYGSRCLPVSCNLDLTTGITSAL